MSVHVFHARSAISYHGVSFFFSCWLGAGLLITMTSAYFFASCFPFCRSPQWGSLSSISVLSALTGNMVLALYLFVGFRKAFFSKRSQGALRIGAQDGSLVSSELEY